MSTKSYYSELLELYKSCSPSSGGEYLRYTHSVKTFLKDKKIPADDIKDDLIKLFTEMAIENTSFVVSLRVMLSFSKFPEEFLEFIGKDLKSDESSLLMFLKNLCPYLTGIDDIIAKDSKLSYNYAVVEQQGRWEPGEQAILADPDYSSDYLKFIGDSQLEE